MRRFTDRQVVNFIIGQMKDELKAYIASQHCHVEKPVLTSTDSISELKWLTEKALVDGEMSVNSNFQNLLFVHGLKNATNGWVDRILVEVRPLPRSSGVYSRVRN